MFMNSVLKDSNSYKFYTGLTLAIFSFLFTWLEQKASKLNYWRGQDTTESKTNRKVGPKRKLSIKEEFVLTLTRIRRGFDVEVLGDIFGVHSSVVSRIFTTWINFLYLEYLGQPENKLQSIFLNLLNIFQRQDPLLVAQNFLFKNLAYLHLRKLHGLSINIIIHLKH